MVLGSIVSIYGPAANQFAQSLADGPRQAFEKQRFWSLMQIIILTAIVLILVALIGRWLWNKALVPSVTFAKPMTSIWPILGIAVLISLLHPGFRQMPVMQ